VQSLEISSCVALAESLAGVPNERFVCEGNVRPGFARAP
jgi:hypothetical protein